MTPRSQQTRISFRSDKAWAKLQRVRGDGRTYSEIIEEALARMWLREQGLDEEDWRASLAATDGSLSY